MGRITVAIPEHFSFYTNIPVRITDINYGGHVGNDSVLSILHEIRMQFLKKFGYTEMDFEGAGLIMSDVAIEFKHEFFYGDIIEAYATAGDFSRVGFDIFYKLETVKNDKKIILSQAKTGMVCFNYEQKKITSVPETAKQKLLST